MKSKKKSIKIIGIILLIGIIITLVLISLNNKNTNISKQELGKEQLTQTASSNAYVSMSNHILEVQNSDSRKYIVKDGVIQSGYTFTNINCSTEYDSSKGCLVSTKTKAAGACVYFTMDLTNINRIYISTMSTVETQSWNYSPVYCTISDSEPTASNLKKQNSSVIDVSGLTGTKYLYLTMYGTGIEYNFDLYDIWYE